MTFPFKHFRKLDIQDNDSKLIVGTCSNITKLISGIIKQSRLGIDAKEQPSTEKDKIAEMEKHLKTVNNWCSYMFSQLMDKFEMNTNAAACEQNDLFSNTFSTNATMSNTDFTIKYLQMQNLQKLVHLFLFLHLVYFSLL